MPNQFISLEMIAELTYAAQGGCEWSRVQLEELGEILTPLNVKYYWESSETHNADFIVTSLDYNHPLAGQYESEKDLIEAGKKAGFAVTVQQL